MTRLALAGSNRIHTLPGRPPFMLIREIAEIVGIKVDTLQKAFRRYRDHFPDGYFFVLTEAEFSSKFRHHVRTSRGKRTDLEQIGMTEKGAILLLSLLTGPDVIAARISLIDTIFTRHEDERQAMLQELAVDRDTYVGARIIRKRIMTAVEEGQTYADLQRRFGYSNPLLITEIQAIRTRGYIGLSDLPVPQYLLRKMAENKAFLDEHANDTRQLLLGLEG